MFVCRSCARRWREPSSALLAATAAATTRTRQPPLASAAATWYSTATVDAKRVRPQRLRLSHSLSTQSAPSAVHDGSPPVEAPSRVQVRDADDGMAPNASAASKSRLDALVRRRLHYLQDPYTIAKAVEDTLAKKNYEEALHLARVASKDRQVVVSWNHLIGYLMREDKLTGAVKLYNEMKKRGQLPNAQTYTIIFRGCARSPHATLGVYQATRLYYSMLASERIKPNTTHMNAVLQVCARARDIESLFSIAKTANLHMRMPDNLTYTTVLNGLRHATALPHHRSAKDGEDDVSVDKEKVSVSIARARAVWEEVVTNWRQGRIIVDEELVCSMGRILLMGDHQDNNDVLSLVEQAMGIPRLDTQPVLPAAPARLAAPGAKPGAVGTPAEPVAAASAAESNSNDRPALQLGTEAVVPGEDAGAADTADSLVSRPRASARATQFAPLPPGVVGARFDTAAAGPDAAKGKRGSRVVYAQPGRNTLSLVLTSIGATRKTSLAARYWDVLTSAPYNVVPDSENWYRMLKALRRGHASTKTTELMLKMPRELMNEKTFQLAMATCAADNLNDNVFASAGKILDLMNKTLRVPDPYALRLYLQTAMSNNRRFRDAADPAAREAAKFAFGRQLVRALGRLWDPLRLLSNSVNHTEQAFVSEEKRQAHVYNAKREAMALARLMVSAADMVVTEGMADDATTKDVRVSRNLLNRQITRFYEARDEREPNLRKGRKKQTSDQQFEKEFERNAEKAVESTGRGRAALR